MIELEPYSEHTYGSLHQARDLKHLIEKERSWLQAVQPKTVERYESMIHGALNIARIAKHRRKPEQAVEASVIRRGRTAIGVATIIHDQQIVHPEAGTFTGQDVDYWLRWREGLDAHEEVARELLSHATQPAMVAIIEGHPNPPQGLQRFMNPVGELAILTTGDREDTFGVARDGLASQLYVSQALSA
jgi:hypothetical protein